jgi:L-fuculose-phosphate aldolase
VASLAGFIADTNAIVMEGHGVTTLGRTISEAYHRLNTLASEVRRNMRAQELAALCGGKVRVVDAEGVARAYREADAVIYPAGAPS